MTQYISGRNAEYLARDILKKLGFTVIRSAKSGNMFDLVAINAHRVKLIQVKWSKKERWLRAAINKEMKSDSPISKIQVPAYADIEIWGCFRGSFSVYYRSPFGKWVLVVEPDPLALP
jgi:hypothetical protein